MTVCIEIFVYFPKSQHATLSFIPVSNHQATDSKKNKFTIIVLEPADQYLLDRVEFKHTSLLNLRQDMSFITKKECCNTLEEEGM